MPVLYYFTSSCYNLIHILKKALIPLSLELDRWRRPYHLCRVDHVRKIGDRKQRAGIGNYSFVNGTIKNWNQLPVEVLGSFRCKPRFSETELGKQL